MEKSKESEGRETNYVIYKQRRRNNAWLQAVRSSEREIFASKAAAIVRKMKLKHVLNILLNRGAMDYSQGATKLQLLFPIGSLPVSFLLVSCPVHLSDGGSDNCVY